MHISYSKLVLLADLLSMPRRAKPEAPLVRDGSYSCAELHSHEGSFAPRLAKRDLALEMLKHVRSRGRLSQHLSGSVQAGLSSRKELALLNGEVTGESGAAFARRKGPRSPATGNKPFPSRPNGPKPTGN